MSVIRSKFITHEPLHLGSWNLVRALDMDDPKVPEGQGYRSKVKVTGSKHVIWGFIWQGSGTGDICVKAKVTQIKVSLEVQVLLTFGCVFADCDSIFKTEWFEIPDTWQDVKLAETVDYTLAIKKSLNSHISPEDPNEFDIAISTQPKLFQKLKVRIKMILNISHDVVVIHPVVNLQNMFTVS